MRLQLRYHSAIPNWVKLIGLKIKAVPECEGGGFMIDREQGEEIFHNQNATQTVIEACCDLCKKKLPFQEAESYPGDYWHDWIQQGRVVGRTRCDSFELRHKLRNKGFVIDSEALTIADYEQAFQSHRDLVKEIDVIINGDKAAKQASLCDLVGQIEELVMIREGK